MGRLRRLLPVAGLTLAVGLLTALGWARWPHEKPEALPEVPAITTTTGSTTTTTPAPTTTVPAATTTSVPDPAIVLSDMPADQARPGDFLDAVVAVSAAEAWTILDSNRVGRLEDGSWTLYELVRGGRARILDLARAPDGTIWAATDAGVFSFDGDAWVRQFGAPVAGVAVGGDGSVWIGGRRETPSALRLWLARREGVSWARVDASPAEPPGPYGVSVMAALRDGSVWMAHLPGYWVEDDLVRYDGRALGVVEITGVPDETPDNGMPAVRVFEIAAAPDGGLWAVGYLAADPDQAVVARYDGTDWILVERALDDVSGNALHYLDLAVGPDGTAWFAFDGGLRSFDGTAWTTHMPGESLFGIDIAPDGTVWYSDAAGLHALDGG